MKNDKTDYVLAELIDLVNKTNTSVSLTVLVSGGALSGRLVSNEAWFESRAALLRGIADGEVGIHTLYEKWHERFTKLNNEAKEVDDLDVPAEYKQAIEEVSAPGYLHLIETTLMGTTKGGGVPFAFRVDLTEVSAWSFGHAS